MNMWEIYDLIKANPGITMKELKQYEGVCNSNLSRKLKRLSKAGLVTAAYQTYVNSRGDLMFDQNKLWYAKERSD